MKGRIIFETREKNIVTTDINIEMKDTRGTYGKGTTDVFDLSILGIQWLQDEPEREALTVYCNGISQERIDEARAQDILSRKPFGGVGL